MIKISDIYTYPPSSFSSVLQKQTYTVLTELHIPFERVQTDEVITMDDCAQIDKKLDMKMVKTLFLCNRQQSQFYLFITGGDKPFSSKNFSAALAVPRVSFAPAEMMFSMLDTKIGAATVFSALYDTGNKVRIVIDKDTADQKWYGCSDGTTTGYLKIGTESIIRTFLPYTHHAADIIGV